MSFKIGASNFVRYNFFFLIALVVASCGKSMPVLEGLELSVWKDDKNGCAGHRAEQIEALTDQKEKLLALDELDIVSVLGKPDQNELYKRNQKFYYYFLEPAAACGTSPGNQPKRLVIRFNAMGLAKEILIEKDYN